MHAPSRGAPVRSITSAEPHAIRLAVLARTAFWHGGEGVSPAAQRTWQAGLGLWLAALVATPILLWTLGPGTFAAMVTRGVLAHAAARRLLQDERRV